MPSADELLEIPWKRACTSQGPDQNGPKDTTLSVYYYQPKLDHLQQNYSDQRFVYFKFIASVSPVQLTEGPFGAVAEALPVWQLLLDAQVTAAGEGGNPYIHAAAPTRRTMIETGMVGASAYEGESNGLAVGN